MILISKYFQYEFIHRQTIENESRLFSSLALMFVLLQVYTNIYDACYTGQLYYYYLCD